MHFFITTNCIKRTQNFTLFKNLFWILFRNVLKINIFLSVCKILVNFGEIQRLETQFNVPKLQLKEYYTF